MAFSVEYSDYGYTPKWAKGMSQDEALNFCGLVTGPNQDSDWCKKYGAYVTSQIKSTSTYQNQEQFTENTIPGLPKWLKQTAVWWGQGLVSDKEFLNAIQFLMDNHLLIVPETESISNSNSNTNSNTDSDEKISLNVISCTQFGTDSMKVEYSVKNNMDETISLELVIKGVDRNDRVLSISTPIMKDIFPGQTKYDHTYIDDYPDLDSCVIGINDAWHE